MQRGRGRGRNARPRVPRVEPKPRDIGEDVPQGDGAGGAGATAQVIQDLVAVIARELRPPKETPEERVASIAARIMASRPARFTGDGESALLETWLRNFDKLFTVVGCPPELMVDKAAFYLAGSADYWWSGAQEGLRMRAKGMFTWEDFKRALRAKYYPQHLTWQQALEFSRLVMGGRTVGEYYRVFLEYVRYFPEERKMLRFESGLTAELRKLIEPDRYHTLDELYQRVA